MDTDSSASLTNRASASQSRSPAPTASASEKDRDPRTYVSPRKRIYRESRFALLRMLPATTPLPQPFSRTHNRPLLHAFPSLLHLHAGNLVDPINSLTHFFGAGLAIIGWLALNAQLWTSDTATPTKWASVNLFGLSLIGLYLASGIFHGFAVRRTKLFQVLRRVDHSMIYVLIAGSYAPFCLVLLEDHHGAFIYSFVAAAGILGIVSKLIFINYIAMGWTAIFFIRVAWVVMPHCVFLLLITGGISYTVGGILYGLRPAFLQNNVYWRAHEVFHLFIMLGSFLQYFAVFYVVLK